MALSKSKTRIGLWNVKTTYEKVGCSLSSRQHGDHHHEEKVEVEWARALVTSPAQPYSGTVDTRRQAQERRTQEHLATGSWPRTDRSGGLSLLPFKPAGIAGGK